MELLMLPIVVLTHKLPPEWISNLDGRVQAYSGPMDADKLAPELELFLPDAEGLLSLLTIPVKEEMLARMPKLRVVSNMAVGVDNIDVAACTRRGIPVGHTPGVLTDATADLTMGILLSAARRLPEAAKGASEGRWTTWSPTGWLGADLRNKVLGIIGMGKIGQAVAERAAGFGLKIIYQSPSPSPVVEAQFAAERVSFDELLRRSDIISLHCPLNAETQHLIDDAVLKKMKSTAILVNAARGPVVRTDALVRALQDGWIAAAALDVTDPEPLPADHPLYGLENCLVVPHIGSATHVARKRMAEIACENLLAGLEKRRLLHCVNPEVETKI
jgi:glyoxylate reductase